MEEIKPRNFAELAECLEKRIESVDKCYDKEIKPYFIEGIGFDISNMSKKEREQFINKRNCLLVQKHCYNEILDLITLVK